ncbi:aldolase [Ornithinimicrobium humiphilum]|uniref:Ribulose-5-phosphate 4-epimerase/fuculose-1-phosphate aldolase n=1 Tax=Ornithinimicrobium humiphilum TaxID=125288 RepID=A0A543KQH4_9MICO|nr:class II aldolase/adducin family protein [Ornithinimicrobium humiphilum]TQM97331.1 ribulose-5-phosphate 4-epimerase/fuculose-1-phosphate aldolase [Ornithinimicrobium humiphilum]
MTDADLREELVRAARAVKQRGLSHGTTGNVSVRAGDSIIITPTACDLATVRPEELAAVSLDGEPLTDAVPSKEAYLHAAVFRNRPEASAIVHTHSLHATAVACLAELDVQDALPALTAYYAMKVEALPVIDYCAPGDRRLADLAGSAARRHATVLLRNHGPVIASPSVATAVDVAEEIEQTAKLFLLLQGRPSAPLDDVERRRLFEATTARERKTR